MPIPGKPTSCIKMLLPFLVIAGHCFSQPFPSTFPGSGRQDSIHAPFNHALKMAAAEICDNNIDDDGNGLTDNNDFACYYSANGSGCVPSKIIWATTDKGLYWGDATTGVSHFVGTTGNVALGDIAWASNGRLYGIGGPINGISEIDPYTGQMQLAAVLPNGYSATNSMTGDDNGNLYITVFADGGHWWVAKYSIADRQMTLLTDMLRLNVSSAGDLTFLNGYLYLACTGSQLARINPVTGDAKLFPVSGANYGGWGLITTGDGYLYVSGSNNGNCIYRVDPVTMRESSTPYFSFPPGANIYGLSTYAEHCNSPSCTPTVSVSIQSAPPFCAGPGVVLQASGGGIVGESGFTWVLPDGTTTGGPVLTAHATGMYKARYHDVPDDCGHDTSFYVDMIQQPRAWLGPDTIICREPLRLQPQNAGDISAYLWQDGSTLPWFLASQPGRYALQASNGCGVSKDTIAVQQAVIPSVYIGPDTAFCPGAGIRLYNYDTTRPWDKHTWSTASTADTIMITSGGVYTLKSYNACGSSSDSVLVTIKDSCTCFPFYAQAALGSNREMCSFDSLELKNLLPQDGFHYRWQNGSTAAQCMAHGPGLYWLDVSTWCGAARDSLVILPKQKGCDRSVHVPNAFSPGGDGHNDLFRPVIAGSLVQYEFSVYNRWGQLLYHTKEVNAGWDGRVGGILQESAVFAWNCVYRFNGLPAVVQKGTVLLVR